MKFLCSSGPTWADPLNIRCSKRWAKPLRPFFSSLEPTWYQSSTVAAGTEWSSYIKRSRPLASLCSRTSSFGGATLRASAAKAGAAVIRRAIPTRRGVLDLGIRGLLYLSRDLRERLSTADSLLRTDSAQVAPRHPVVPRAGGAIALPP